MSNLRIANRYAEAVMTSAEELHVLKNVSDDFTVLRRIVIESHEFQLFLKSPIIKNEKKKQVFEATFGTTVQPLTLKFLILLTEKGRADLLLHIIEAFFRLQDLLKHLLDVLQLRSPFLAFGLQGLLERFEFLYELRHFVCVILRHKRPPLD